MKKWNRLEDQVARGSERQNNDFDEVNRSLPRALGDSFLPPFIRSKERKKTSAIDSGIGSDIDSDIFRGNLSKILWLETQEGVC